MLFALADIVRITFGNSGDNDHAIEGDAMGERSNEIDLEAFRWVVALERGPLSPDQRREFEQWISACAKHEGAFHRAMAANLYIDRLVAHRQSR